VLLLASCRAALRRLFADRRGTTAIEFGFVGLIFFTLLLGAVDIGRYQFTVQSLRDISAEAARAALIDADNVAGQIANGTAATTETDAALKTAVTSPANLTPFLTPSKLTLVTARATAANGVTTITVTATYPFQFVAPVLSGAPLTLSDSTAVSY